MLQKFTLRPGINTQLSATLEEGGFSDGNLVRFPYGVPQPVGGWTRAFATAVVGMARALLGWTTLGGVTYLGIGTDKRLLLLQAGQLIDVTPIRTQLAIAAGQITSTPVSRIVTVIAAGHGCNVGDTIVVVSPVVLGSATLSEYYTVTAVSSSSFAFDSGVVAGKNVVSSTVATTIAALTPIGMADVPPSTGWGSGGWGAGAWGTARVPTLNTGALQLWSLDHWGDEMVGCIRNGGVYTWKPGLGTSAHATLIPGAPTQCGILLVGMPERHLIVFGCNAPGYYDPMLVAWSDVEDYTTWLASDTNSAGTFRLATGTSIVGVLGVSQQQILIWTESSLYVMRFIGLPYVYSIILAEGDHTGLIAQNAAVTAGNGLVFWMGINSFWTYTGAARPMVCAVWDRVFGNLNRAQAGKITAGSNAAFGEVWWFYPSANATENDSLVIYDYINQLWSIGNIGRTAWLDTGVFPNPIAADPNSILFNHETGTDADGAALPASVTTGYTDLASGDEIPFVDQLMPDFSDQAGTVNITVASKEFPNDAVAKVKGPFPMTTGKRYLSPRLRGRQMQVTLASVGTGVFWRLGALRARIAASGRQ